MERQDAPFSQILEYRNWIRRLQMEEELGPLLSADLDLVELEAEELELQERAEHLKTTLLVLEEEAAAKSTAGLAAISHGSHSHTLSACSDGGQAGEQQRGYTREGSDGENGGGGLPFDDAREAIAQEEAARSLDDRLRCGIRGEVRESAEQGGAQGGTLVMVNGLQTVREEVRGDVDIIKAKLRIVQDQLDHLRGVDTVEVTHGNSPAEGAGRTDAQLGGPSGSSRVAGGQEDLDGQCVGAYVGAGAVGVGGGVAGGVETGPAGRSVAAGLAAELGSKWGARTAEPREGARVAAEGTLEDAPEPCMLAQGTIDTAQRLWKFGL